MKYILTAIILLTMTTEAKTEDVNSSNHYGLVHLSASDQHLCKSYKEHKDGLSTNDWMRIESILPLKTRLSWEPVNSDYDNTPHMTKDQLIELLGNPTIDATNQLVYVMGWTNGTQHSILLRIEDGRVYRSGYRIMNP